MSLNIKNSAVVYVAEIARRADEGARKENRGRPKLLSPRELRGLHRLVEENPFASLAELSEQLNAERTNPPAGQSLRQVSPSTVHRAVNGMGMRSCAPTMKQLVFAVTKKKRLQWAKDHLSWSIRWASVL